VARTAPLAFVKMNGATLILDKPRRELAPWRTKNNVNHVYTPRHLAIGLWA
jgi:hypothetical protein